MQIFKSNETKPNHSKHKIEPIKEAETSRKPELLSKGSTSQRSSPTPAADNNPLVLPPIQTSIEPAASTPDWLRNHNAKKSDSANSNKDEVNFF